jgi:hypothetical protein
MLRGCKHYFSMFGILLFTINATLAKLFCRWLRYSLDRVAHATLLEATLQRSDPHRRQIYQQTFPKDTLYEK